MHAGKLHQALTEICEGPDGLIGLAGASLASAGQAVWSKVGGPGQLSGLASASQARATQVNWGRLEALGPYRAGMRIPSESRTVSGGQAGARRELLDALALGHGVLHALVERGLLVAAAVADGQLRRQLRLQRRALRLQLRQPRLRQVLGFRFLKCSVSTDVCLGTLRACSGCGWPKMRRALRLQLRQPRLRQIAQCQLGFMSWGRYAPAAAADGWLRLQLSLPHVAPRLRAGQLCVIRVPRLMCLLDGRIACLPRAMPEKGKSRKSCKVCHIKVRLLHRDSQDTGQSKCHGIQRAYTCRHTCQLAASLADTVRCCRFASAATTLSRCACISSNSRENVSVPRMGTASTANAKHAVSSMDTRNAKHRVPTPPHYISATQRMYSLRAIYNDSCMIIVLPKD